MRVLLSLLRRVIPITAKGNLDHSIFASVSLSFAFGLLNGTFYFFYVKIFLNVYQVEEKWFHISQAVFMIWNALNDPLFGYLLNNPNWRCFRERRIPILVGGPLYAICYLIPWFPWGTYSHGVGATLCGLQLLASLCLYDTLFSYLGLTACCLTTEMFVSYEERLTMKWYTSIATLLATFAVPLVNFASENLHNMSAFRATTCFLAVLAALALWYCGMFAVTAYEEKKDCALVSSPSSSGGKTGDLLRVETRTSSSLVVLEVTPTQQLPDLHSHSVPAMEVPHITSNVTMTRLVLTSTDFQAFVWTNFLQYFHLAFWGSFTNIIVEHLAREYSSPSFNSIFYWVLEISPTLLFLCHVHRLFTERGYYHLFVWAYRWKVIASLALLVMGPRPTIFLLFLLQDSIMLSLVSRIQDVLMSDISDKIMADNKLSVPQSSVLVGLNALITKPAQSLCPMLAVWVLNRWGNYQEYVNRTKVPDVSGAISGANDSQLRDVMFYLSCGIPLIVGVLQCIIWSRFTIRR